jgi:hypothetical protein
MCEISSLRLVWPIQSKVLSDGQPGSYQLACWVSTDKRACLDWAGHPPSGRPLERYSPNNVAKEEKRLVYKKLSLATD